MTYMQTGPGSRARLARRYGARRAPPQAMGGFFDFVEDIAISLTSAGKFTGDDVRAARAAGCESTADAGVAMMGAQIDEFQQNWNPTGFYTPDQMMTVINAVLDYAGQARQQIQDALANVDIRDSDHVVSAQVFDKAYEEYSAQTDKAILFVRARNEAVQKGSTAAINAPGLRFWVLSLMKASQSLAAAAIFVNCNKTPLENMSRTLNALVDRAISIIKAIVGIVLKAGQFAVDVAGDLAGSLLKLLKYAPYVLLLGGGLYAYKLYRDR